MINGTPHVPQGRQLPPNWRNDAPARAKAAEEEYMRRLQNAWLAPKAATMVEVRPIRSCRLAQFY
jgi:hypothetical protein